MYQPYTQISEQIANGESDRIGDNCRRVRWGSLCETLRPTLTPPELAVSDVPHKLCATNLIEHRLYEMHRVKGLEHVVTNDKDGSRFEPVLLDLADTDDYVTIIHALEEYAADQDWKAEGEQERIRDNKLSEAESDEAYWRKNAARARRIANDIERQLDANCAARRSIDKTGE